jgi:hypothetical protein
VIANEVDSLTGRRANCASGWQADVRPAPGREPEAVIENISKGGFRFLTRIGLEPENRLVARICFTDGRVHERAGRICYCDEDTHDGSIACGFSVISGFYSL